MDTSQYVAEAHRQLSDNNVYRVLSHDSWTTFERKIMEFVDYGCETGIIDRGLKQFLLVKNLVTPILYLLP